MTTDFSYGDKTINSLGPIKPSGTNQPLDPRTEVKLYADIETIPNPYVGMIITVLEDETNQNKMTDYKVISLKPNALGIANSVIDQVQRYANYLGISNSGSGTGGAGLTSEQSENLNKVPTIEQEVTTLTTIVGNSTSGLVKDVKDLKTNGVSQDNINTAVENYLSNNSIENGLIFTGTAETGRIIEEILDETVIKQQYLGGYIEIQPDSWDGEVCATDGTTKTWGFPYSLIPTERNRAKEMLLHGKGTNIMYIRFPLGFAYRGFRNIDETSRLAKNIGERFKGQNKTLRELFKDISSVGGGLAPEYWCPPPYWLTSGSYNGSNELSAGGSYSRTTKLSSIKTTDPTQYSKQIDDFTNAVVNDLEYLHQNIAPVRMFGLQNEPQYNTLPYGSCAYDAQTYNDVLEVLYPKIQASAILSEYEDEPNEIKLLVASSDEEAPFDGIGATFIQNHSDMIWGYTHHSMRKASAESGTGAEWYKSDDYKTKIKSDRTNVFINEYEYFTSNKTDEFRCGNNMLRLIFELIYGEAKVLHPVIHIFKPIGQTLSGTNTRGYCLLQCNLNGEYGYDLSSDITLNKGTFSENKSMFNSWGLFGDNLPIGSYVIGNYNQTQTSLGWCALKFNNKLYIFMANSGVSTNGIIKLTFSETKKFSGKCYSMNYYGEKMASKSGSTIEFLIPPSTGIVWIEQESNNIEEPSDPTIYGNIVISNSSVSIDENSTDTFTVKLDKAPTNNQTVNVSINNAYTTIDKTSLIFTPNNYSTEQTVTVTGAHLDTDYSNKNSIITLSSPNVSSKTINVTITNIDIEPILDNITAVYTQGNTKIYPDTSLDSLKSNLIVTANYTDGSNSQVTNYTLSGTLTEGTSTITVTYNGKSTTFNVNVIARPILSTITAVYTQGSNIVCPSTLLDSLKEDLVVTAIYTDDTSETITDYTLSGTLTEGTSTITVTYNEKTTTFDVTVSKEEISDNYVTSNLVCYADVEDMPTASTTWRNKVTGEETITITKPSLEGASPNQGIYINGDEESTLDTGITLTNDASCTLEMLVRGYSIYAQGNNIFYLSTCNKRTQPIDIGFSINNTIKKIGADFRDGTNFIKAFSSDTSYTSNTWVHIIATYDSINGIIETFINGESVATQTVPKSITHSSNVSINIDKTNLARVVIGMIRVYDGKALNSNEVQANYLYEKNKRSF